MAMSIAVTKRQSPDSELLLENDSTKLLKLKDPNIYPSIRTSCRRAPISSIPSLSKSTQEIIESIKSEKLSNKSSEGLISNIKPTEKYSYLLSDSKSLPLPHSYLKLTRLFKALDSTIFFFNYSRSPTAFAKIQDTIEKTYFFRCNKEEVQKIISVYPESYRFAWHFFEGNTVLFIEFFDGRAKDKDEISSRKKKFDEIVIGIVKGYHEEYLKKINESWTSLSEWHPDFPIFEIPDFELAMIPEKPLTEISDISSFVTKMMTPDKEAKAVVIEGTIEGLSPAIAAKILAKESLLRSQKMAVDDSVIKEHSQGEKIFKMIEILRTLFSTQKTPSIFLNILVTKLAGMIGNKNYRVIQEDLLETVSMFPNFLSVIKTNSGDVVRFTKISEFKLADARQQLKIRYDLQE